MTPRQASTPGERESAREFLDSLSDTALAPDPNALYRRQGKRREVDLGTHLTASLDERPSSLLDSRRATPGTAGPPGRVAALTWRDEGLVAELAYQRAGATRTTLAAGEQSLAPGWSWSIDQRRLTIDQGTTADGSAAALRRKDAGIGLRWQALEHGWLEAVVRRESLDPTPVEPLAPSGSAEHAGLRGRWQSSPTAGWGLHGVWLERLRRGEGDDSLTRGRFELGADYRFKPDSALHGLRVYTRQAPRLGLLSEGESLSPAAAFKRVHGAEWADGSAEGSIYTQWRESSLAAEEDTLWAVGWRHTFELAPRSTLITNVEQAIAVRGPTAQRSFTVGGRWRVSRFPSYTVVTDVELVNSDAADSFYTGAKLTRRLARDWMDAWTLTITHTQPHGDGRNGTTDYKGAATLGWREPDERRLVLLGRYTVVGRRAPDRTNDDRRGHILMGHLGYAFDAETSALLRVARRRDVENLRTPVGPNWTTMLLARASHELGNRWSVSAHVAQRRDGIEGVALSQGAEVGLRLSSKAALAVGYNPRGFSDNELSIDEMPRRGWNVRLRFTVDGVIGRWLDAPLAAAEPAPTSGWLHDLRQAAMLP